MLDPRHVFEEYKAGSLVWSVKSHPDYEGYYLATDEILNIRAIGDTAIDATENLKDCVDKFVETVLDSEDEEAIERLIVNPILNRGVSPSKRGLEYEQWGLGI